MERNGADKSAARLRILIVEDDALIAMDTEDALVQAGCEVVGVANRCQTAVELCGVERPDLVVMDISLAGQRDGVEAAKIIRKLFDIPVIFVSGQTSSDLVPRASEAKAVGWLSKPLDRRKLSTGNRQGSPSSSLSVSGDGRVAHLLDEPLKERPPNRPVLS